jgi:hypothetical protein
VTPNLTLTVSGSVGLGFGVAIEGKVNLLTDELSLGAGESLTLKDGVPTEAWAGFTVFDKLSMLGGEIDLAFQIWFFGWHDLGSIKLFSWPNWVPVNGYLLAENYSMAPIVWTPQ